MIKNLLNADEEPPEGMKVIKEEVVIPPAAAPEASEISRQLEEAPIEERFYRRDESGRMQEIDEAEVEAALAEIGVDLNAAPTIAEEPPAAAARPAPPSETAAETVGAPPAPVENQTAPSAVQEVKARHAAPEIKIHHDEPTIFQNSYEPLSTAETIRNSGLAYSAVIVLVGAVVMMMIFGWLVDLLLGTSPLGIVGGIIIGGAIGFVQFFRIASGIFKK